MFLFSPFFLYFLVVHFISLFFACSEFWFGNLHRCWLLAQPPDHRTNENKKMLTLSEYLVISWALVRFFGPNKISSTKKKIKKKKQKEYIRSAQHTHSKCEESPMGIRRPPTASTAATKCCPEFSPFFFILRSNAENKLRRMDEADKNKKNRRIKSHTHAQASRQANKWMRLHWTKWVKGIVNENVGYRFATLCKFAF